MNTGGTTRTMVLTQRRIPSRNCVWQHGKSLSEWSNSL